MRHRLICVTAGLLSLSSPAVHAAPLPVTPLTCSATRVAKLTSRLEGVPGSGSVVVFANGGIQVSYDVLPAIQDSHVGDHLFVCLVFKPSHCPRGDLRGKIYTTTNLRSLTSWTLPDSQHSCGGA